MKPIKLILQAFGPFADRCEIDFLRLYSDGVYLITGDTGSGKTTIFDGITYCLYGSPSGSIRSSKNLVSKYAKDDVMSFAALEFEHNGKIYYVERSPEQTRKNRRDPSKTIIVKATASLTLPNKEVIESVGAVDKKIVEILGINRDQFKRTSMLAQGDFQKLLFSSTSERQEIFRKLFGTQNYEALQERIKLRTNDLKQELDGLKREIYVQLSSVRLTEGMENIFEDIDLYGRDTLSIIDKLMGSDSMILEENAALAEKTEKQYEDICAQIIKLSESTVARQKINAAHEKLHVSEKLLAEIEEKLKDSDNIKKKISALAERIVIEENELYKYDEAEEIKKNISSLISDVTTLTKDEERTKEDLLKNETALEDCKKRSELLKDSAVKLQELKNDLAENERTADYYKEIHSYTERYIKLYGEYEKYRENVNSCRENQDVLRQNYDILSDRYFASQAGILASSLEEGRPCPVCGSTHHPSLAHLLEDCPSKEHLDAIKSDVQKAENRYRSEQSKLESTEKLLENCYSEIYSRLDGKFPDESITSIGKLSQMKIDECQRKSENIQKDIASKNKEVAMKAKLDEAIPKGEILVEKIKNSLNEKKILLADKKANLSQMKKSYADIKENLPYSGREEALSSIRLMKEQKMSYEYGISKLENEYSLAEKEIVAQEAEISAHKPQLIENDEVLLSECETNKEMLLERKRSCAQTSNTVNTRISINSSAKDNLEALYDMIENLGNEYSVYAALNETFSGRISGRHKIELETYIQMRYFDRVLQKANVRFLIMSGGRYELRRRETPENLRSSSGLEIDIYDHYNDTLRGVETLSGGESFLASLSLALGLSDEVRESIGSVNIDTLFVDEGFGSLDSHALSGAMNVISSLSSPERPVAIISHVEDLKSIVDKRIIVIKSTDGSKAVVDA